MANLYDYLKWRHDITFSQAPLNEVDNLIFSLLSYVDFAGIVDASSAVSLRDAAQAFLILHPTLGKKSITRNLSPMVSSVNLLGAVAQCKRFCDVRVSHYQTNLGQVEETQFAAVVFEINSEEAYVAYRGTDTSLVGWKEDFKMVLTGVVPAREQALDYLNGLTSLRQKKLYIGGHSKGGNLAVYASVHCKASQQARIVTVYNNDGPGFNEAFVHSGAFALMQPRMVTIVPQQSIVGLLFCHGVEPIVVGSAKLGLLQHDMLHWQVLANQVERVAAVSRASALVDDTLMAWLASLDEAQKIRIIDLLFEALQSTGATYLEELEEEKLKAVAGFLKTVANVDKQTRDMLIHMFWRLFMHSSEQTVSIVKEVAGKLSGEAQEVTNNIDCYVAAKKATVVKALGAVRRKFLGERTGTFVSNEPKRGEHPSKPSSFTD